jgi:hypothetical protein
MASPSGGYECEPIQHGSLELTVQTGSVRQADFTHITSLIYLFGTVDQGATFQSNPASVCVDCLMAYCPTNNHWQGKHYLVT